MSRYQLQQSASGLCLADTCSRQHPVSIDFVAEASSNRIRKGGASQELLAKATGLKKGLRVVDCTAGLGRDAFTLAYLGCDVTMIERSAVMAMLLEDALQRAECHLKLKEVVSRLRLIRGDAVHVAANLATVPDVILIDPMFPKRNKTALVQGDMQLLQRFLGVDEDAAALLEVSLSCGCPRVVLKRPVHDKSLSGVNPTYSLKGSTIRFDVFINSAKQTGRL
ncbi:MAG: class I SAM-dependent methyltransferase [Gammaproteobacteria bacterium]|nr:class I SAM-dependent methyltransferase [Gammaproteobacteria bacterium]